MLLYITGKGRMRHPSLWRMGDEDAVATFLYYRSMSLVWEGVIEDTLISWERGRRGATLYHSIKRGARNILHYGEWENWR